MLIHATYSPLFQAYTIEAASSTGNARFVAENSVLQSHSDPRSLFMEYFRKLISMFQMRSSERILYRGPFLTLVGISFFENLDFREEVFGVKYYAPFNQLNWLLD
jgi:hypothetical protein